ncbi:hypothetical protein HDU76_010189 [Blyttiomyces sp. JEL0837]|nr:hypothetical protein HDU76_010189 [Blyttiomyces sp. JEL0837]
MAQRAINSDDAGQTKYMGGKTAWDDRFLTLGWAKTSLPVISGQLPPGEESYEQLLLNPLLKHLQVPNVVVRITPSGSDLFSNSIRVAEVMNALFQFRPTTEEELKWKVPPSWLSTARFMHERALY